MAKSRKVEVSREISTVVDCKDYCTTTVYDSWDGGFNVSLRMRDGNTAKVWRFKLTSEQAKSLRDELTAEIAKVEKRETETV